MLKDARLLGLVQVLFGHSSCVALDLLGISEQFFHFYQNGSDGFSGADCKALLIATSQSLDHWLKTDACLSRH